jgi:primosomal protein N' (replication factor Y)
MFCRVVLREATTAFDREYTYAVPPAQANGLQAGCRVEVPFGAGNRLVEAYVLSIEAESGTDFSSSPFPGC